MLDYYGEASRVSVITNNETVDILPCPPCWFKPSVICNSDRKSGEIAALVPSVPPVVVIAIEECCSSPSLAYPLRYTYEYPSSEPQLTITPEPLLPGNLRRT